MHFTCAIKPGRKITCKSASHLFPLTRPSTSPKNRALNIGRITLPNIKRSTIQRHITPVQSLFCTHCCTPTLSSPATTERQQRSKWGMRWGIRWGYVGSEPRIGRSPPAAPHTRACSSHSTPHASSPLSQRRPTAPHTRARPSHSGAPQHPTREHAPPIIPSREHPAVTHKRTCPSPQCPADEIVPNSPMHGACNSISAVRCDRCDSKPNAWGCLGQTPRAQSSTLIRTLRTHIPARTIRHTAPHPRKPGTTTPSAPQQ